MVVRIRVGFRGNLSELLEWELPVHSRHHSAHANALSLPVLPGNTLGQLAWVLVFHVEPTCDRWLDPGMSLVGRGELLLGQEGGNGKTVKTVRKYLLWHIFVWMKEDACLVPSHQCLIPKLIRLLLRDWGRTRRTQTNINSRCVIR